MICVSAVTKYKYHYLCTHTYVHILDKHFNISAKARNLFLCILQGNSVLPHIPICMIIQSVTATQSRASPWQKAHHHHQAGLKVQPLHEHKEKCFFFSSYMISFYLGLTSWTERYLCKKSPLVGGCVTHSCNGSFLENECLRSWFSVCSSSLILSRDWKWMSPYSPLTLSLPSIGNVTASMDLHRINCRPKKESFKIYQNQLNYWIATVQIPLRELKTVF